MSELIDDILKLSRASRKELNITSVNLSTLAEEIIINYKETQPERKIKVKIQENMFAEGDYKLLKVMLENLLSNAWKFTENKKSAKIEFYSVKENSVFCIKDNGVGFNIKYAEKLFIPFQRLHGES